MIETNNSRSLFGSLSNDLTIYNIVLLTGLCGYPIVAGLTPLVDAANFSVSAALRTITVGAALLSIVKSILSERPISSNWYLVLIGVFWCLYVIRLLEATAISDVPLAHGPYYYWTWAMLGCAIPMFGLAVRPTYIGELERIFPWVYLLFCFSGVLTFFSGSTYTGRFHLVALNPISLGHLGATICILAIWALVCRRGWTSLQKVALFLGAGLGFYLLVSSNSRGPLVAFVLLLAFLILVSGRRYALVAIAISAGIGIIFVPLSLLLEHQFGLDTFSRLFGQEFLNEINVSIRIIMYQEAIEGILAHPITGWALEIPSRKAYPHNIVVEGFMAVGLFGGVILLFVVMGLVIKGTRLFRRHPEHGWIVLIFIQNLIGGQFSGALYSVTYFWILVGVMISLTYVPRGEPRLTRGVK